MSQARGQAFKDQFMNAFEAQKTKMKDAGFEREGSMPALVAPAAIGLTAHTAGMIDAFTGETNMLNSGEAPLNFGMAVGVGAAGSLGAAAGAAIGNPKRFQKDEAAMKADLKKEVMEKRKSGMSADDASKYYTDQLGKQSVKDQPLMSGINTTPRQLAYARRGAAIAASAALVPAIMSMRDQPKLAQQADSLM